MSQSTALHSIHFPADQLSQRQADKRLAFNEHLRISIENQVEQAGRGPSIALTAQPKIEQKTLKKIPFVLTSDQTKTIKAIYRDLSQTNPTHRLIQGDTGSGKTVTLIFAANQCLSQGLSCAIMAPTEILANQHYRTFCSLGLFPRQTDATHSQMFHQFEGLVIDKNINISHLIGVTEYFAKSFFGNDRTIRLRPHHFQFTEPSFEIDISCGLCHGTGSVSGVPCKVCKSGWLELGGAGMVHPNVLTNGGIDPHLYSGFAFGWGVERVLMMKPGLNLNDLRILYSDDIRFLKQF